MLGVPAILINTLVRKCMENNIKFCETGPMLETNGAFTVCGAILIKNNTSAVVAILNLFNGGNYGKR
jgi:hypothetical protein